MNAFLFFAGLLYIGGAIDEAVNGSMRMAGVLVCYAAANFFLGFR